MNEKQIGLTAEECYLKQKSEIERLKDCINAEYKHHLDSKEQVLELLKGNELYDEIEEIFDENLNSQNYYYE